MPVHVYRITADNFSGPSYVTIRRESSYTVKMHHMTETARLRRLIRQAWGPDADVIRHGDGYFSAVWCGLDPVPFPGLRSNYDRISILAESD